MPSPIAHAVSGYVLTKFIAPKKLIINQPTWLDIQGLYGVFVAIFADFDFIPQLITGIQFHRGVTHTLIFALGFSLVVAMIVGLLSEASLPKVIWFNFLSLWFSFTIRLADKWRQRNTTNIALLRYLFCLKLVAISGRTSFPWTVGLQPFNLYYLGTDLFNIDLD